MVQRSTSSDEKRSCTVPTLCLPRDISIPKHRHRRLQPHWASPALARSPRSAQRIVAGEVNDGRLGNYAEPRGGEVRFVHAGFTNPNAATRRDAVLGGDAGAV